MPDICTDRLQPPNLQHESHPAVLDMMRPQAPVSCVLRVDVRMQVHRNPRQCCCLPVCLPWVLCLECPGHCHQPEFRYVGAQRGPQTPAHTSTAAQHPTGQLGPCSSRYSGEDSPLSCLLPIAAGCLGTACLVPGRVAHACSSLLLGLRSRWGTKKGMQSAACSLSLGYK
jgi:hypothetical protein